MTRSFMTGIELAYTYPGTKMKLVRIIKIMKCAFDSPLEIAISIRRSWRV